MVSPVTDLVNQPMLDESGDHLSERGTSVTSMNHNDPAQADRPCIEYDLLQGPSRRSCGPTVKVDAPVSFEAQWFVPIENPLEVGGHPATIRCLEIG